MYERLGLMLMKMVESLGGGACVRKLTIGDISLKELLEPWSPLCSLFSGYLTMIYV